MSVIQAPSPFDRLAVVAELPHISPARTFDYWTAPDLLCRWWPQEAEIHPYLGGMYHLSWPQMNWHLRGRYLSFVPGKQLAFTWKWDHDEENAPLREVSILFEPLSADSTRLTLTHGPYTDSEDDQDVRIYHHLEGWMHFLPRLQALSESAP